MKTYVVCIVIRDSELCLVPIVQIPLQHHFSFNSQSTGICYDVLMNPPLIYVGPGPWQMYFDCPKGCERTCHTRTTVEFWQPWKLLGLIVSSSI